MTDKEKLEKIVAYLMRRMYVHNQMADIGSTGEVFDEKIENAKYEECKDALNFIDSMQEEPTTSVWHVKSDKPKMNSIIVMNNDQTTLSVEYVGQSLYGVERWAYLDSLLKL